MTEPQLTRYLDFRQYLKDWFAYKKATEPGYSHRTFAIAAGLGRSTLHNITHGGRSPTPTTLDGFTRAIGLGSSGRRYLELLVELDTASSVERRRQIMERITGQSGTGVSEWMEDRPDVYEVYLSRWYFPAVLELARHPAFRAEPTWIAATLVPSITEQEAAEALRMLQDLDLLDIRNGKVEVKGIRRQTRPDTLAAASAQFHRHTVPTLLDRMAEIPAELRHLMATVVLLPTGLVPEVKQRIVQLVQQISDLADDPAVSDGRAYQLCVQLMPVSETLPATPRSPSVETSKVK